MALLFSDNFLRSLGWTFVHSLWIGFFLVLAGAAIMLGTKRSSPTLRYGLLYSLFFVFLAAVTIAFAWEWNNNEITARHLHPEEKSGSGPALFIQQAQTWIDRILTDYGTWIISIWLIVFLMRAAKMTNDLFQINRLRNSFIVTPTEEWQYRFEKLRGQLNVSAPARLLESALVKVPIVIGYLKPIVLVPAGILSDLPPKEIEAVLLHELAHIRRNDYLVNLIQRVTEMIFFFNPGLLWISSLVRAERENCCDDAAINCTNNREEYVNALIRFREHAMRTYCPALGFPGQSNALFQRISRIVYRKNRGLSGFEGGFALVSMLVCFALLSHRIMKPGSLSKPLYAAASINNDPVAVKPDSNTSKKPASYKVDIAGKVPAFRLTKKTKPIADRNKTMPAAITREQKDPVVSPAVYYPENIPANLLAAKRAEAEKQREIAGKQRQEADELRKQAELFRADAEKQRQVASKQREEADKIRQEAEQHRKEADSFRAQAEVKRQEAELFRKQAELDRRQAEQRRDEIRRITGT